MSLAHRHGKAGQFGKSESQRRLMRVMTILALWAVFTGVGFGYFAGRMEALVGWVSLALALTGIAVGERMLSPVLDKMTKERIRYLRGGQVEALVAWLLEDLGDEWHVFNGVMIRDHLDIDHVLLGPGGLYSISTKSCRGLLSRGAEGRVLLNLRPTQIVAEAQDHAMQLKARMEGLMVNGVPWVQPVLAVPFAWVDVPGGRDKVWILHQENLLDAFEKLPRKLSKDELAHLLRVMKTIADEGKNLYRPPTAATRKL